MSAGLTGVGKRRILTYQGTTMRLKCRLAVILGILILQSMARLNAAEPDLERGFLNPPDAAKPWVLWFWLNGNVTREGITADLEAMRRVGLGGVLIMEVNQGTPPGPVAFMSDEWRALFKFVVSEASTGESYTMPAKSLRTEGALVKALKAYGAGVGQFRNKKKRR